MSKARAKGTKAEVWMLEQLRHIWPLAERAPLKGINDRGDFVNLFYKSGQGDKSLPLEMKSTNVSRFPEWIRVIRGKAEGGPWGLAWTGDRRTAAGQPVLVVPLDFGLDLLHHYFGPVGSKVTTEPIAWEEPSSGDTLE